MGCCYCCCLLCWLEETYSHIVGCQAPRLKKRSQIFQESRPPLSPSHIRAAGHFRAQCVRKKRWLEKLRAVLVASNLTNSDAGPPWSTMGHPFTMLLAPYPATIWGAGKNSWRKRWLENYYNKNFRLSYILSTIHLPYSGSWSEFKN